MEFTLPLIENGSEFLQLIVTCILSNIILISNEKNVSNVKDFRPVVVLITQNSIKQYLNIMTFLSLIFGIYFLCIQADLGHLKFFRDVLRGFTHT